MAGLREFQVAAVLRAENIERARAFYTDVLGLEPMEGAGSASQSAFLAGSGTGVFIYERPGMPAPQNTTLGFAVPAERFDDVIAGLGARGVTFEEYDLPEIGLKTVDGVADFEGAKGAWFKDSEGNIINVNTM